MKKLLLYVIIAFFISLYFVLTIFVLPPEYLSNEQFVPQPYFDVILSESEISLGESFRLDIISENKGDYGDIHIVSVAFPNLTEINNSIEIVTYDFSQSPTFISTGDKIGARYSGGLEYVTSQYPSIEAMNRPTHSETKYNLGLVITPQKSGVFSIYVKAVDIPHVSNLSHYPKSGALDHQNEYVLIYSVNVS